MRNSQLSSKPSDEADESAFISMTDMTVSILFILLILLAFFASQLRLEQSDPAVLLKKKEKRISEYQVLLKKQENELLSLKRELGSLDKRSKTLIATRLELRTQRQLVERLEREIAELKASRQDRLQAYNADVAKVRRRLLFDLQNEIDAEFPELQVRVSSFEDALQVVGEGLFGRGSYTLSIQSRSKIERISEIIDDALPCYTIGVRSVVLEACNPAYAVMEALQIEGHTDSDGARRKNVRLGALRAASTYSTMISHRPGLIDHENAARQPVLSVAGYGEDRPVASNETASDKGLNRRIDLRFIMLRPATVDDITLIKDALKAGVKE